MKKQEIVYNINDLTCLTSYRRSYSGQITRTATRRVNCKERPLKKVRRTHSIE